MAERSQDRSPKKARGSQAPQSDPQRRRWPATALLLSVLLVLVVAGWATGAFAFWPMLEARQAVARRDADAAERWIRLAERLHGDRAHLELLKARLSRQRGDVASMAEQLDRALARGADRNLVHNERLLAAAQAGQLAEIEERLRAWLAEPGQEGAAICDAYTNGLTILGRLDEAQALLDAWEAGFPDDPQPHVKRGRIAEHARAYQQAEEEYRRALAKHPTYAPALYSLARLLLERNRPQEALPLFRECAAAAPTARWAAQTGEASCLRLLDQADEARVLLEEVVAAPDADRRTAYALVGFQPAGDPAAFELGKLESAERNYEAAERWLRATLDRDGYDLEARYALAGALRGLGRQDEAQAEFDRVAHVRGELAKTEAWQTRIAEQPDDVESRYKVGLVYLQHQSPKLGLYWLQSVLAYDPAHRPTHHALADYYETHQDESPAYHDLAAHHRMMARSADKD